MVGIRLIFLLGEARPLYLGSGGGDVGVVGRLIYDEDSLDLGGWSSYL